MADIDDELLALVGGGDESEEESEPTTKKTGKRRGGGSDDEEGEASSAPGSPASQASAPMDESDSDNDVVQANNSHGKTAGDDEGNSYPVDGIFTSEAEKDEIMELPELKREQFIADRQQEVDRQRQNTLLRALLKSRDDGSKKRKAGSDDEDAQRKTGRQRTKIGGGKVGETSSGIESLRRARAEKNDRRQRREEDRERNKDKSLSFARDDSDRDDDSDVDWADGGKRTSRSRTPEVKEIPVAEPRDMERVRVGRSRFAQVCFFPGFEQAIKGCFVRVALGPDRDGIPCYRMAVIKGFTEGKPYAMEKSNGQMFVTDQYVRVAHGKAEREWPFISCSDSPFTESEFNRYKSVCNSENVNFPKKPAMSSKIDDINGLVNRSWTDEEVNEKIQRERELRNRYNPDERERLNKSLDEAKRRGDDQRASELQEKLESLDVAPRLAFKTSLTPTKNKTGSPGVASQQDRLAQLNAINRKANAEKVRRAQMMEKAKVRKIEERIARGEEVLDNDTSRRHKTKPKFVQDASDPSKPKEATNSGNATPTSATQATKATVLPHLAKLQLQNHQTGKDQKGVPQIHKPIGDDDIIAAMDMDIDVDIDID